MGWLRSGKNDPERIPMHDYPEAEEARRLLSSLEPGEFHEIRISEIPNISRCSGKNPRQCLKHLLEYDLGLDERQPGTDISFAQEVEITSKGGRLGTVRMERFFSVEQAVEEREGAPTTLEERISKLEEVWERFVLDGKRQSAA